MLLLPRNPAKVLHFSAVPATLFSWAGGLVEYFQKGWERRGVQVPKRWKDVVLSLNAQVVLRPQVPESLKRSGQEKCTFNFQRLSCQGCFQNVNQPSGTASQSDFHSPDSVPFYDFCNVALSITVCIKLSIWGS